MSNHFILLLSSNQDSFKNMEAAKYALSDVFPEIKFSNNIESETVVHGNEIIPKTGAMYLNAIAIGLTSLELEEAQVLLKNMETNLGRVRNVQSKGLVIIDLDLVEWNAEVLRPKDAGQSYYKECLRDIYKVPFVLGSSNL